MLNRCTCAFIPSVVAFLALPMGFGCGSSGSPAGGDGGGSASTGGVANGGTGAAGAGGDTQTSQTIETGGNAGTGGTTATGGSATPGTTSTGGTAAIGGTTALAGNTATGGTTALGGSTASGGTTGGAEATGGTAGTGATTTVDGGASLQIPVEQVEQFQSCSADTDCHIVWVNCGCFAVRTEVSKLLDPRICGTNLCISSRPTAAVCTEGRCELFLDPHCTVDSDCKVLWSYCSPNAPNVDAGASCACAAVHQSNDKTSALVSADGGCPGALSQTATAVCSGFGRCTLSY